MCNLSVSRIRCGLLLPASSLLISTWDKKEGGGEINPITTNNKATCAWQFFRVIHSNKTAEANIETLYEVELSALFNFTIPY